MGCVLTQENCEELLRKSNQSVKANEGKNNLKKPLLLFNGEALFEAGTICMTLLSLGRVLTKQTLENAMMGKGNVNTYFIRTWPSVKLGVWHCNRFFRN